MTVFFVTLFFAITTMDSSFSHACPLFRSDCSKCQRKTRYAKILIGSWLFLTAMAIYLSLWVAPLDFQQGYDSRILYVHVPVAWMSIVVYIATAINSFLFLLTKHPLFALCSSRTGTEIGAFFTLFTLVTGGFWGRPMWGTFWVVYVTLHNSLFVT